MNYNQKNILTSLATGSTGKRANRLNRQTGQPAQPANLTTENIMTKKLVSIVKYEKPLESVRRAVELSRGLDHMPKQAKVFIKPNIVFWTKAVNFPKYGVITTSRVVEDMVVLLKERGIDDISISDGTVLRNPKDMETQNHAFESLGYGALKNDTVSNRSTSGSGSLKKWILATGWRYSLTATS